MNVRHITILNASFVFIIIAINDFLWLRVAWAIMGIIILIIYTKAMIVETIKQALTSTEGLLTRRVSSRQARERTQEVDSTQEDHPSIHE